MKNRDGEFSKLKIFTKRLVLRPFLISDYEMWAEARRNRLPKQNEFDRGPIDPKIINKVTYRSDLRRYLSLAKKDRMYILGIFDRKSGASFGVVSMSVNTGIRCELNNQWWGRGIAREAVQAALPYALSMAKIGRFEAKKDH